MKYVFLIAAFNAFFFTILLSQKKPREHHDRILIAWLIYLGVFIGIYSLYSHELFTHFRLLSNSLLSLFMLHGPFLYLYVNSLVKVGKFRVPSVLLHLLPIALFNLYILFASTNPRISFMLNVEHASAGNGTPVLYIIFLILTALSGPFYFLLTTRLFRKLDIDIANNYSSRIRASAGWLRKLIAVFAIVWTGLIIVTVVHHVFNLFTMVFCTDGLFLSLSVFVILIGYFGLKQRVMLPPETIIALDDPKKVKYAGSKLTDNDSRRYASELASFMKQQKPYLNPELTLAQLSEDTGIPAHYLSQVINEQFGKNFFDFVNGYRVEEFKEKVTNPVYSGFSLLGVALESGFNSKTAFNRVFRQVTGQTPSEYKKNHTAKKPEFT